MKTLFSLSIIFCITAIIIFSCSKSTNPDPVTPDPVLGTKQCIAVTLTSPKGTDSQTVGLSVPITPISYKISNNQSSDTSGLSEVSVSAIGLPSGIITTYKAGVLTISGSAIKDSSNPYVYVIVASGNVCSVPLTGVISVKKCATIIRTSASPTLFQVVPTNTAIAPVTFEVGGGGTGVTVTGLPPGITSSFSGGIVTVSGTLQNAPDGAYLFKVTTSGGYCNAYDSAFIVVTTCPMVTLTSPAGTDNQFVSRNQPLQPITYSVTGHYTSYTIYDLPPGVTATFVGGIITITGAVQNGLVGGQTWNYMIQFMTSIDSYCMPATAYGDINLQ